ncbi:unnamed protein product, partial [Rhizoctonia solani]
EEESEYNGLHYGSRAEAGRLEVLTLGLQSCIDSLYHTITEQEFSMDVETRAILGKCLHIGIQFLKSNRVIPMRPESEASPYVRLFWQTVVTSPEQLSNDILACLGRHLEGQIDLGPVVYSPPSKRPS